LLELRLHIKRFGNNIFIPQPFAQQGNPCHNISVQVSIMETWRRWQWNILNIAAELRVSKMTTHAARVIKNIRQDSDLSQEDLVSLINEMLARTIALIRTEKGITQEQLSEETNKILAQYKHAGVPGKAGISKIERNNRQILLIEGLAIAMALGIPVTDLAPPEMTAQLVALVNPMEGYQLVTATKEIKKYRHPNKALPITIYCDPGLEIPYYLLYGLMSPEARMRISRPISRNADYNEYRFLYWARGRQVDAIVPDLPGCVLSTNSQVDLLTKERKLLDAHLESLSESGIKVNPPVVFTRNHKYVPNRRNQHQGRQLAS
jgi:transcriptional regulator with XRE-family HTH domain